MNGATPPASRFGLSCLSVPATITSWCEVVPGSVVTTSMLKGRNVSFTHATSASQWAWPCGYALSVTVLFGMLERLVIELSLPGVTVQPFGRQLLMNSLREMLSASGRGG